MKEKFDQILKEHCIYGAVSTERILYAVADMLVCAADQAMETNQSTEENINRLMSAAHEVRRLSNVL